jgi:hypothetical protein
LVLGVPRTWAPISRSAGKDGEADPPSQSVSYRFAVLH